MIRVRVRLLTVVFISQNEILVTSIGNNLKNKINNWLFSAVVVYVHFGVNCDFFTPIRFSTPNL